MYFLNGMRNNSTNGVQPGPGRVGPGCTTVKGARVRGVSKRSEHSHFGVTFVSKLTSQFKEVNMSPLVSVPRALVLRRYVHGAAGLYLTSLEVTCCYIVVPVV